MNILSPWLHLGTSVLQEKINAGKFGPASFGNSTLPSNPSTFLSPIFFLLSATSVGDLHCPQTHIFCRCVHILLQRERKKRDQSESSELFAAKSTLTLAPILLYYGTRLISSYLRASFPILSVTLCQFPTCTYTFKFCSLRCCGHQHLNILTFHLLKEILSSFHFSTSVTTCSLPNLVLIIDF